VKTDKITKNIIEEINRQFHYFSNNHEFFEDVKKSKFSSIRVKNKTENWKEWAKNIINYINKNNKILTDFRKTNFFITDVPGEISKFKKFIYKILIRLPGKLKKIDPKICMLEDLYDFVISENLKTLLVKNPAPKTGNPELYYKNNTRYW
jgi:hypothetical protein